MHGYWNAGGRVTAIEGAEMLSAKQQRELAEFIIKRKMKTARMTLFFESYFPTNLVYRHDSRK
ncbi:hypothetical protein D3C80_1959480 [compost metagenome]